MISMMLCLVFSPWRGVTVEDSDFIREEIDIFPGLDDSIPPGIESDNYDSEGDDNSTSLPEFESFHVDYPIREIQPLMWIAPDFEASRARGFVLRSLELQSSTLLRESNILILSTNVLSLALLNNGFGFT
ncbi:hypothetical protein Tco_0010067 [Tanacetum coccineum]